MHGFKRICVFCLVTTFLPALLIILPLYLRHSKFADVYYKVAESDILEIRHGISSVFCERHSLRMNTTFNAFQLNRKPKVSEIRKHIRLRKSMILPDDTLEYWGFYLLKGATVSLKVCSRYDGSRILVVKGDKDLKTCGLLEHNKNKYGTNAELGNVIVTFETNAEVIVNDTQLPTTANPPDEDEDGLGTHFDVPKIKYNGEDGEDEDEDENNASERDDIDFTLLKQIAKTKPTATPTTTTTTRASHRKRPHSSSSSSSSTSTTTTQRTKPKGTASSTTTKKGKTKDNFEGVEFTTLRINKDKSKSSQGDSNDDEDIDKEDDEEEVTMRTKGKSKDEDDDTLDAESWTEYVKTHRKVGNLAPLKEIQRETTEMPKQTLVSLEDDGEDVPLTSRERRILEKYLKRYSQRTKRRSRRDLLLEAKVNHGGTALNFTDGNSNSVSSFENNLLSCYDGQILLAQSFPPSTLCRNVKYLEQGSHMVTTHEISADGYYYYIFYSDNDNVKNDINALFDIHKPTFLYANITDTNKCYNSTSCSFPIEFLTDEVVIVEVPTRDGIEHEGDDFTVLISTCHPRMAVYVIFPIAVLFLILSCAFL